MAVMVPPWATSTVPWPWADVCGENDRLPMLVTDGACAAEAGAEGLAIVSVKTYDHPTDRVFELRARGPSRQFDIARSELGSRPEVLNVLFD